MARRSWDESDVRVRANKRGSRPRTKQRPAHEDAVVARVVAVDRGRYTCVVDEDSSHAVTVSCVRAKELRRKRGISDAGVCKWRSGYGGMEVSGARRLKALEAGERQEQEDLGRADDGCRDAEGDAGKNL